VCFRIFLQNGDLSQILSDQGPGRGQVRKDDFQDLAHQKKLKVTRGSPILSEEFKRLPFLPPIHHLRLSAQGLLSLLFDEPVDHLESLKRKLVADEHRFFSVPAH